MKKWVTRLSQTPTINWQSATSTKCQHAGCSKNSQHVTAVFRTTPKQSKEASPKERLERVIKDQQVILRFPIGRKTANLDHFLAALGDILVRAACHSRWGLGWPSRTPRCYYRDGWWKRSKAGIYPLNGYLLLSFKREIFRFVWVEA